MKYIYKVTWPKIWNSNAVCGYLSNPEEYFESKACADQRKRDLEAAFKLLEIHQPDWRVEIEEVKVK